MPAPGSTVTTLVRSGPPSPTVPAAGTAFLAAPIGFGPLEWQLVRSVAEADAIYGAVRLTTAGTRADLVSYFENGGEVLYLKRSTGPAAAGASLGLADADDDEALSIGAVTVGAWANSIRVAVAAGSVSGYKLTISDADEELAGLPVVLDNLATPTAGVAAVNTHPILARYVRAELGVGGAAIPEAAAATNLAGGDDDVAGIVPADVFPPADLGAGVIIGPTVDVLAGLEPDELVAFLELAIDTRRLVFAGAPVDVAYLDPSGQFAEDVADIATNVAAAIIDEGADALASFERGANLLSCLGAFHGVVYVVVDGLLAGQASPVAAIAGLRARAHATEGPHRVPAGEAGILNPVATGSGASRGGPGFSEAVLEAADAAGGNGLRTINGSDRLYGYKPIPLTLATGFDAGTLAVARTFEARWPLLTARDVVNVAAAEADAIGDRYVMRPIDPRGHVFADLRRDLLGLGERMAAAGSLYSRIDPQTRALIDPGYAADTGPNVNTPATIEAGQILGELAVRPTPSAPFVSITVAKVALTSAI